MTDLKIKQIINSCQLKDETIFIALDEKGRLWMCKQNIKTNEAVWQRMSTPTKQ